MAANRLHLIYIVGTYPLLTTTFIDREIRILRSMGADLRVFSIRRPPDDVPLSESQVKLQGDVTYLLPVNLLSLILSQLYFVFFRPVTFFRTLLYLLSRPHPGWMARLKTLLHFGEGVYLAFLLRGQEFEELHAHFLDRAATMALVAGRLLRKPYSLSIHAGADIFVQPVLLREKIAEARQAATCTLYNKTHLEKLVGTELCKKITFIPHGLEMSDYQPFSSNGHHGKALILAVGQLAERKGFVPLIRSCHELRKKGYQFECQIIGNGPQRQELEALINRLSLQDVVFLLGALPHETVLEYYKRATLFALPCIQTQKGDIDGIPNVLLEAMAMQVPVISTTISAIPELLQHQENGLLVAPDDPAALAEAIAILLDTPSMRRKLGMAGRESILVSYNVENNVKRFVETLWPDKI